MLETKKQKIQELRNRMKIQLKSVIENSRKPKKIKKSCTLHQAYEPNFFQQLSTERISTLGTFQETFEEKEKLGEGAQSVVKKVVMRGTTREYAVKAFKQVDTQMIIRIRGVFLMLRTLNFPTVIKPHYLFISNKTSTARVIIDYLPYPNLETIIKSHGSFAEQFTCNIIKVLLETVAYLHSKKVCHRDIKPANILYNIYEQDQNIGFKLIDYEICKYSMEETIEMWTTTGSLFYKAPEMFKGSYNEKIDVWSCGIIAFELLHGYPPFCHEFMTETIDLITSEPIDDKFSPDIGSFAKQFIKKCLNKQPEARISASEALKEPFILKANTSPVTPKNGKLNSSFDLPPKNSPHKRTTSTGKHSKSKTFNEQHENVINNDLWS